MAKTEEEQIEPWVVANQYAKLFGDIPASFITLVRTCMNSYENKDNKIEPAVAFELKRFIKSDSMRAPLYFYIKTFKPELLDLTKDFSKNCTSMFKADEIAAVLPILCIFRRAQRLISEEDWKFIGPSLETKSEIGLHIGMAIPKVGAGFGLITGVIRYLGLMTFLIHDKKGFGEYRRHLKLKKLPYEYEYEISRWGCTHVQVAVNLLVGMGYPSKLAQAVQEGLEAEELKKELKKTPLAYGIKVTEIWADALVDTGSLPGSSHDGEYYPMKDEMDKMNELVALSLENGTQYAWLSKVKENINQDETPELM